LHENGPSPINRGKSSRGPWSGDEKEEKKKVRTKVGEKIRKRRKVKNELSSTDHPLSEREETGSEFGEKTEESKKGVGVRGLLASYLGGPRKRGIDSSGSILKKHNRGPGEHGGRWVAGDWRKKKRARGSLETSASGEQVTEGVRERIRGRCRAAKKKRKREDIGAFWKKTPSRNQKKRVPKARAKKSRRGESRRPEIGSLPRSFLHFGGVL